MGFTLTYDGDNGVDVLEAALARLIRADTTLRPWVADITYLGRDEKEVAETVGLTGILEGNDVDPTWLLTRAYDAATDTFAPAYRENRIPLVMVMNVTIV